MRGYFFISSLVAYFFFALPATVSAQNFFSVSGKVSVSGFGAPIEFATVYLAKTMIGTRTELSGKYELTNIPPGKYEMIVSCVGYKMKRAVLEINKSITDLNVTLSQDVTLLKEVTVKTSKSEYRRRVALFSKFFLGTSPAASKCTIVNPDDIQIGLDKATNMFTAYSLVPVEVENKELGYRIYYTLLQFSVDLDHDVFMMEGIPRFEPLFPNEPPEKFAATRDRCYLGSVTHFMQSLRANKLAGNRFQMQNLRRQYYTQTGKLTPSTKYDYYPLTADELAKIRPDSLLELMIIYTGATQDYAFDPKRYASQLPQTSLFYFRKHHLVIHENGYYDSPLDFFMLGYWSYRENTMAQLLPIEYEPIQTPERLRTIESLEAAETLRRSRIKPKEIQ